MVGVNFVEKGVEIRRELAMRLKLNRVVIKGIRGILSNLVRATS